MFLPLFCGTFSRFCFIFSTWFAVSANVQRRWCFFPVQQRWTVYISKLLILLDVFIFDISDTHTGNWTVQDPACFCNNQFIASDQKWLSFYFVLFYNWWKLPVYSAFIVMIAALRLSVATLFLSFRWRESRELFLDSMSILKIVLFVFEAFLLSDCARGESRFIKGCCYSLLSLTPGGQQKHWRRGS